LQEILNSKDTQYKYPIYVNPLNYKKYLEGAKEEEIETAYYYDKKIISNQEMDRIVNLSSFLSEENYVTEIILGCKYSEIGDHFWNHFVPAMQKLGSNTSNTRMVFWFDS
jgi:hypothetical protein